MLGTNEVAAISYHELYLSMRRAGFRRWQATYLVGQAIHACVMVQVAQTNRD